MSVEADGAIGARGPHFLTAPNEAAGEPISGGAE